MYVSNLRTQWVRDSTHPFCPSHSVYTPIDKGITKNLCIDSYFKYVECLGLWRQSWYYNILVLSNEVEVYLEPEIRTTGVVEVEYFWIQMKS